MLIAIASQNRRTITDHTGRCRRFWLYHTEHDQVLRKEMLELTKEQTFHASPPHAAHALDDVDVLICGGMGPGLEQRLAAKGIHGLVSSETDPDRAVAAYLNHTAAPNTL